MAYRIPAVLLILLTPAAAQPPPGVMVFSTGVEDTYGDPAGSVLYVAEADGSGSTPIIQFHPDTVRIVGIAWQPMS